MAGQIKQLLEEIVAKRANGNALLIQTTRAKLIFKGVNPDRFDHTSPDDPAVIAKVKAIATELGVTV